jgi:hypothetical protein
MSEINDNLKKGRGRPKKIEGNFQQNQRQYINNLYQQPQNNLRQNNNFSIDENADLKEFITKKNNMSSSVSSSPIDIDDLVLKEIENIDKDSAEINIANDNDYNPLEEAVEDRGYTKGMIQNNNVSERIIDEPMYNSNTSVRPNVDDKLLNPHSENTNSNNSGNSRSSRNSNYTNNTNNNYSSNNSNENQPPPQSENSSNSFNEEKGGNEKKLTLKEQRDGAEKTADIALLAWKNYLPLPFIYFGTINVKKLKDAEKKGEIDLQAPIDRRGTLIIERIDKFNKDVENSFEVTEEEVAAIREPLIDVLMEKEVSLTPTQRLIFVAGQFVVAKVINVVKLIGEQKEMIADMKEMHKEKMDFLKQTENNAAKRAKRERPPIQVEEEDDVIDDDENDNVFVKNNSEDVSEDAARKSASDDIKNYENVNYTNIPSLDEVIDMTEDDDTDEDGIQIEKEQELSRGNDDDDITYEETETMNTAVDDNDDNDIPD